MLILREWRFLAVAGALILSGCQSQQDRAVGASNRIVGLDLNSLPSRAESFWDREALRKAASSDEPSTRVSYLSCFVDFGQLTPAQKDALAVELINLVAVTPKMEDQKQLLHLMSYIRPAVAAKQYLQSTVTDSAQPGELRGQALESLSWYWERSPSQADTTLVKNFLWSARPEFESAAITACFYGGSEHWRLDLKKISNRATSKSNRAQAQWVLEQLKMGL